MEYTLQEIEYLSEGILWNLNAKSEEGQKQNRLRGQQLQAGEKLEKEKSKIDAFLREGKVRCTVQSISWYSGLTSQPSTSHE